MAEEVQELISVQVNVEANETIERPLNEEEIAVLAMTQVEQAQREADQIAKEEAKISGMAKLMNLGLTEEEAKAMLNV